MRQRFGFERLDDGSDSASFQRQLADAHEARRVALVLQRENADLLQSLNFANSQLAEQRVATAEGHQTNRLRFLEFQQENQKLTNSFTEAESHVARAEKELAVQSLQLKNVLTASAACFNRQFPTPEHLISFLEQKPRDVNRGQQIEHRSPHRSHHAMAKSVAEFEAEIDRLTQKILDLEHCEVSRSRLKSENHSLKSELANEREKTKELGRLAGEYRERLDWLENGNRDQTPDHFSKADELKSSKSKILAQKTKIAALQAELESCRRELMFQNRISNDAIPAAFTIGLQTALHEILENDRLPLTQKITFLLAKVAKHFQKEAAGQTGPDLSVIEGFIPEISRLALGRPCDLRSFLGTDTIGKQIVAKWRQNLGAIAEGIKIRDELSDEVDSLRRKLQAANRQILKMADPTQLGHLIAESGSSVREQAQARWTRPEGDEWDSGDDYERVVTELKSKCYKQPSRVRSILSSSD